MLNFNPQMDITTRTPLKADPSINNNVLLELVSVNVETKEQKLDEVKAVELQSEYSGKQVPRIYFEFKQVFMPNSELAREGKDRFYVYIDSPIVSFKNAINAGEAREAMADDVLTNLYTEQFKHLMHIYRVFEGTPNYKPITEEIKLNYKLDVDARLAMFKTYFDIVANGLNGVDGKSAFLDKDGKNILLIAKVIVNKGGRRLDFPSFTGSGFIEKAKISGGKVVNTFDLKANETVVVSATERGGNTTGMPIGGMPPPMATKGGLDDLINNS